MESKNIIMLADVRLAKDDYTIKIRIVGLWKQMMWSNPNQVRQIGMLLMDEQRLGRGLDEYVDVYIHKPTLGSNRDTMKFSNSDHKMYLYSTTKNGFSFADDEKIPTDMSIVTIRVKLVDVYDLEDDVDESATKPPKMSTKTTKDGCTTPLLIPKVEK
ncbi:hypothetical protein LXL04_017301 [Taraxacum kok-saghyz]